MGWARHFPPAQSDADRLMILVIYQESLSQIQAPLAVAAHYQGQTASSSSGAGPSTVVLLPSAANTTAASATSPSGNESGAVVGIVMVGPAPPPLLLPTSHKGRSCFIREIIDVLAGLAKCPLVFFPRGIFCELCQTVHGDTSSTGEGTFRFHSLWSIMT